MQSLEETYGKDKAKDVFYAMLNTGRISGVESKKPEKHKKHGNSSR